MIELRQLRYFVAVAEELSFTAGAAREGISQPALSRQIRSLEDELGVELIIRDPRTGLSPAGKHLLPRAKSLLADAVKSELSVRQFAACRLHRLDVGYFSGPLAPFIGAILGDFQRQHDEVKVVLHELSPGDQLDALREGKLDLALIGHATPQQGKEFDLFHLTEIPLQLVSNQPIKAAEIPHLFKQHPIVKLDERRFPGRKELIDKWARAQGHELTWTDATDGLTSAMLKISSGQAIGILPDSANLRQSAQLHSAPLDGELSTIDFQAAVVRDEKRSNVRKFLTVCRQHQDLLR